MPLPLAVPVGLPSFFVQETESRRQPDGTASVTEAEPACIPIGAVWPVPVTVYVLGCGATGAGATVNGKSAEPPLATFLTIKKPPPGVVMQSNGLLLPPL